MTSMQRFLYGGIGALMPVLVTIVSLDLAHTFSKPDAFSTANIIGFGIRYLFLFVIGGIFAYFHTDEEKAFKLFEIGIAAPALITSIITANAVKVPGQETAAPQTKTGSAFVLISSANAADSRAQVPAKGVELAGDFLNGVLEGVTGRAYNASANAQAVDLVAQYLQQGNAWTAASAGGIPEGAVPAGREAPPKSETLFACRAAISGGLHLGKVRTGFAGCKIGWGGSEQTVPNYQVLTGQGYRWVLAKAGELPARAVQAGEEHPPGKEALYVCRAWFNGGTHPGKFRPAFRACGIGWSGKEHMVPEYEVLVK